MTGRVAEDGAKRRPQCRSGRSPERAALIDDRLIRQWSGWCGAVLEVAGLACAVGVEGGCETAG
jgi:hypothetical protein